MNLDLESSLGESKIDPESKIKSDPELKIQDQNCDPESMSSKHSS